MSTHMPDERVNFVKDQVYVRRVLLNQYGGQQQGGISTPRNHPIIFLFTGEGGEAHGYGYDGWRRSTNLYEYTGEGQQGDMTFQRGNKAIRDHQANGKRLFLFHQLPKRPETRGKVRFMGEMACVGYRIEQHDSSGTARDAIVFLLEPVE